MKKAKQITALIAIILLVGLYVATFVASFFSGFNAGTAFAVCLILTVTIPLIAFVVILFFGRAYGKKVIGDPDEIKIPEADAEIADEATDEADADSTDIDKDVHVDIDENAVD